MNNVLIYNNLCRIVKPGLLIVVLFLTASFRSQAQTFTIGANVVNLSSPALDESSGLEYCRGKIWTHNDSGGDPKIYSVSPDDGSILQTITIGGASNVDWEDLTSDGYCLYIADTGNNVDGARTNLVIYKINLDDIPEEGDFTIPSGKVGKITFYYEEQGTSPSPVSANNTPYDCEAIVIRNDVLHLFTKDWTSASQGYGTSEYLLPAIPNPGSEKYAAKLFKRHDNINFLVTGVDNAGIDQLVMIGYQSTGLGGHYARIYSGFTGDDISTGSVKNISLGTPFNMGQAEAICFGDTPFTGYISNERFTRTSFPVVDYRASLKTFTISGYDEESQIRITTGTAGSGIQGSIRYNSEKGHMEGFDGLYWIPLDTK